VLETDRQGRPEGRGPQRAPLTRQRLLDRALAVIDRDGLENLSMRRLAAELDVSAMSLYNHVPSKEVLLQGVTETLLREIDLSAAEAEDWTEAIKEGFRSFRRVLLAHPHALPLIQTRPALSPEAFRPVEVSLATLRRAGFDEEGALKAHWLLVGYTLGHVAFMLSNPLSRPSESPPTAGVEALAGSEEIAPEEFRNLFECLPFAVDCDLDEVYEFGLETIIEGLRGRVEMAGAAGGRSRAGRS
jgi:TetR/AcrR family tetracycline transcriptional repressor